MHVYVGLDLGVKNEEIKNSFAPGFNPQREESRRSQIERGTHDDASAVSSQRTPLIFLHLRPEPELENGMSALPSV